MDCREQGVLGYSNILEAVEPKGLAGCPNPNEDFELDAEVDSLVTSFPSLISPQPSTTTVSSVNCCFAFDSLVVLALMQIELIELIEQNIGRKLVNKQLMYSLPELSSLLLLTSSSSSSAYLCNPSMILL
jgi:hypothetical protein